MEEILVINDDSRDALHAAEFAFNLAQRFNKNLLVANITHTAIAQQSAVTAGRHDFEDEEQEDTLEDRLNAQQVPKNGFKPAVEILDASRFQENDMAAYINKHQIYMVVQGVGLVSETAKSDLYLHMQSVLSNIHCPLLLVPEHVVFNTFEHIVYLTDLRYCQHQVISFLTKLTQPDHTGLLVAHICEKGLPEMDYDYANDLFKHAIRRQSGCDGLYFNMIREKNMPKTVDVLINCLDTDLLVCINRHSHFASLLGEQLPAVFPDHVTVPVLVFPG